MNDHLHDAFAPAKFKKVLNLSNAEQDKEQPIVRSRFTKIHPVQLPPCLWDGDGFSHPHRWTIDIPVPRWVHAGVLIRSNSNIWQLWSDDPQFCHHGDSGDCFFNGQGQQVTMGRSFHHVNLWYGHPWGAILSCMLFNISIHSFAQPGLEVWAGLSVMLYAGDTQLVSVFEQPTRFCPRGSSIAG